MTRRTHLALGLVILAASAYLPGCSSPPPATPLVEGEDEGIPPEGLGPRDPRILDSVIKLIRDAATNEGGDNFNIAVEFLNAYFRDAKPEEFALPEAHVAFLAPQITPAAIEQIRQRTFEKQRDGRHIEDSLLYHAVATRVAGEGDDLTRVRRLFDWVVRHNMLVPVGALGLPGIPQAQARPYDVMLRGMATEGGNGWSERGWLFMTLCRQIGVDAGMIVYTLPARVAGPMPPSRIVGPSSAPQAMASIGHRRDPRFWAVAVLIGGKPYMFDPAIGLPIPSADGKGVATLEQALTDPRVLAQLELPGDDYDPSRPDRPARPSRLDLAASSLGVQFESTLGSLSPRMKLFQQDLKGKNQMVLYRDPVELADAFQKALGDRCEGVGLWRMPLTVEHRLHTPESDGNFMTATLYPLQLFIKEWPLLSARLMQLHGETKSSIQSYVVLRFAERPMARDGKTPIPPNVQGVLDIFATYFLALAQMEKGDADRAKFLFGKTLEMLPEPNPRLPYYMMLRWGAATNLGLLHADSGDQASKLCKEAEEARDRATQGRKPAEAKEHEAQANSQRELAKREWAEAIRYLSQDNPTPQGQGNLLRAAALIRKGSFVPPKDTPKVIPPLAAPGSR